MKEGYLLKRKKIVDPRIDILGKNGLYLEIIFLLSQILEEELKSTLLLYKDFVNNNFYFSTDKRNKNFQFSFEKDIEKLTLGQLIVYLSFYYKKSFLLKDLNKFNKLRIDAIHKLFQIKSVKRFENQIKIYLNSGKFWKIMLKLSKLEILIIKIMLDANKKQLKNKRKRINK